MGGGILRHKSWHVGNREHREMVQKAEAVENAKREAERQRQRAQNTAKQVELLRQRTNSVPTPLSPPLNGPASPASPSPLIDGEAVQRHLCDAEDRRIQQQQRAAEQRAQGWGRLGLEAGLPWYLSRGETAVSQARRQREAGTEAEAESEAVAAEKPTDSRVSQENVRDRSGDRYRDRDKPRRSGDRSSEMRRDGDRVQDRDRDHRDRDRHHRHRHRDVRERSRSRDRHRRDRHHGGSPERPRRRDGKRDSHRSHRGHRHKRSRSRSPGRDSQHSSSSSSSSGGGGDGGSEAERQAERAAMVARLRAERLEREAVERGRAAAVVVQGRRSGTRWQ